MDEGTERAVVDEDPERRADERSERTPEERSEQTQDERSERTRDERSERTPAEDDELLQELVAYLRDNRTDLREEWARRISEANLLRVMSDEEIFSEATEVFDNYVDALETGSIENLQAYARELSERIIPRGVETDEVLGIVLLLRDALARSLFAKYQDDLELLNRILDSYEPAANRIAVTVGVSFVEERERVIHEQQEAMRELSTPVLQLRDRLLILPIIGVLDSARARQLTEQLLALSATTAPRSSSSTSPGSRRSIAPWPTTSSRPSRRRGSWARGRSSPASRRRSPRRSSTSASTWA